MKHSASQIRKLFDRSVLPHLDVLYTVACQFTGSAGRAAGACRETMARAYRQFPAPPGRAALDSDAPGLRTWLLKILFGILGEECGQPLNGRAAAEDTGQVGATNDPAGQEAGMNGGQGRPPHRQSSGDARQEGDAIRRQVRHLFRNLPAEDRAVLMLVDVAGLRYEEAARVLDVPIETVRCRVAHARILLRCALGPSLLRSSIPR
jgi:DNA-directed RNA polymerase specialized sigma24 family protein